VYVRPSSVPSNALSVAGAPGDAVAVGWNAADAVYFDEISVTDSTTVEGLEVV